MKVFFSTIFDIAGLQPVIFILPVLNPKETIVPSLSNSVLKFLIVRSSGLMDPQISRKFSNVYSFENPCRNLSSTSVRKRMKSIS
ncbi:MAG: hypothetical protein EZS28_034287 [Streblomastix strix]|uniref:Uncharacterized protein n=1 Tax=Streblomastix strix TaxID=222440 RepID=A0A5J4UHJ9_9EUKA|nr:MAG: hypothetical protein EZS28_034287 [Streblomastix strix]